MSQKKNEIIDSDWNRIHKTHYIASSANKVTSSYSSGDIDPRLKLSSSYLDGNLCAPSSSLNDILHDISTSLFDAYSESNPVITSNDMVDVMNTQSVTSGSINEQAYDSYAKQLGRHTSYDAKREQIKILENFKTKLSVFPKHLSYEGSVVLCVMLSMEDVAYPNISNLPAVDQTLIRSLLPTEINNHIDSFIVEFDEQKDFILQFKSFGKEFELAMFNSVAHPRPEDLRGAGVVPVENDGDRIAVGGKIVLDKKGIKKLIGVEPLRKNSDDHQSEDVPRRQAVAGRNAFEIRADVLDMALTYTIHNKNTYTPTEIVDIAKKFYSFVENKTNR